MKLDLITNKIKVGVNINLNDEYYTPIYAIEPLLQYLKPNSVIWCPFDLHISNYVKVLEKAGHTVHCTHIEKGRNFFTELPPLGTDYIISNPPYSLKYEIFDRLFKLDIPFAMLVGVVGIFESKERFTLFKNNNFEMMYFDKRVKYFKDYSNPHIYSSPPYSSVYICKDMLPNRIVFENINIPSNKGKLKNKNVQ